MHQKNSLLIENIPVSSHFSSSPNPPPIFIPSIHQKRLQIQIPRNNFDQIPFISSLQYHQNQFQNEPNSNNPSTSKKTLLSTPHKRPVMISQAEIPSNFSRRPSFSSLHHHHHHHFHSGIVTVKSLLSSFLCSFSLELLLATKAVALRLIRHSSRAQWLLKVSLRIVILLFLPSLYFLSSNNRLSFLLHFLCVIIFSAVLVICLNISVHRFPYVRLLFARLLPIKLSSPSKSPSKLHPPVIWSIGSKAELEKRPNSGSWVQVHRNGDVYEGEFYKGKCSGSGVYYYYMSGRYEGDWVDEKYDGYGIETWAKGSKYRGQYRQGLRNGFGVFKFYTGDVYAGEWCNGQSHGFGAHTCEDGSSYVGEFKWGVKHGIGRYHFRNGDIYAGEYFADKMHGFGVYRFRHGHQYEGAWHEGKRQGLGLYTFRNGETQSGHWENGVLNVTSTVDDTPTGSPFTVSHTRVLNAVQESRHAAEKTVDVAKVDEKVNNAVAAANKAANAARVAAVKAVQNKMLLNNDDDLPV